MWITAPVAVKTVTGWYKLVGSKKGKSAVTGEVQLSFNVSRSGEDLGSTGPVNRLSLMYVTITVLSARGLRAVDTKKKTSDVMCVVKVGGVTRKTRVCKGTTDPVWIQQFEPMPFVAGFFTMIEVKLVHPHWMSHVNLGHVDIPMTQVLLLSDIEVEDQDPSSVNLKRVADKHATRRMRQSMANAAAMRLASKPTDNVKQLAPPQMSLPLARDGSLTAMPPKRPSKPLSPVEKRELGMNGKNLIKHVLSRSASAHRLSPRSAR